MSWDRVRKEIANTPGPAQHDQTRRKKIAAVERITKVPLIVYAADFTDSVRAAQYGAGLQIDMGDKTGFMQALSDVEHGPVDILLHSPGGSPTAAESIVELLRARFSPIRFLIPHAAKSAATMLAMSGDEILMGEAAELGPIDPQFQLVVDGSRGVNVPAGAAIDQFARIQRDVTKNPGQLGAWLPIIRQYGPSFLQECHNAVKLSETLVTEWLAQFMFAREKGAEEKASKVAKWLAQHGNFNSHARPIGLRQLREEEPTLKIRSFGDEGTTFENAVMELYWSIELTFDQTNAFKIVEHKAGSAYIRLQQQLIAGPAPASPTPGNQKAPGKRQSQRRG